ncbi:VrrA/YqfQ family protein [Bacillus sp. RO1]|uniref:VrrA/YqfQ family protein n=1 Tax=Bacillus sp. RO1 TaxID=2722703 RepID=UPI0014567D9D|nr:VrrA/YqfQ family protein [Bacillus sp. RO1]NLP49122.1 spore coat protein [Bacillus sp. RO1]
MFFGPNRSMPPMQQPMRPSPFQMGPGPSPFMQQPQNNMFNMLNMPNSNMSNMPNPMLRNPSSFMGGAGRGMGLGGNSGGGGGGLLAKLFGRTGARSIGNMGGLGQLANTGAGGGLGQLANAGTLQQLINPNNLTGMLGNVQKALKMAEGVMPMVQQYGPLVRNMPAMLKLYNELKNVDDDDDNTDNESTEEAKPEDVESESAEISNTKKKVKKAKTKPTSTEPEEKPAGGSAPKLYI